MGTPEELKAKLEADKNSNGIVTNSQNSVNSEKK